MVNADPIDRESLKRKDDNRRRIPPFAKKIIISLLCNTMTGALIAFIYRDKIPHRGVILDTKSPRVRPAIKASLFFNIYERSEIEQVQAFLDPNYNVIECGASIGATTTQILRLTKKKVVCVEADPSNTTILNNNIELNFGSAGHRCAIINAAIDYSGRNEIEFTVGESNLVGRSTEQGFAQGANRVSIPAQTIGKIVKEYGMNPFILVTDIEGAEAGIFASRDGCLASCYRIIGEFDGGRYNGRYYSISDLVALLSEQGFEKIYEHANRMVFQNCFFPKFCS